MTLKRGLLLFVLLIFTSLIVGWLILRPPPCFMPSKPRSRPRTGAEPMTKRIGGP